MSTCVKAEKRGDKKYSFYGKSASKTKSRRTRPLSPFKGSGRENDKKRFDCNGRMDNKLFSFLLRRRTRRKHLRLFRIHARSRTSKLLFCITTSSIVWNVSAVLHAVAHVRIIRVWYRVRFGLFVRVFNVRQRTLLPNNTYIVKKKKKRKKKQSIVSSRRKLKSNLSVSPRTYVFHII